MSTRTAFSAMPWQTYQVVCEAAQSLNGLHLLSRRWRFSRPIDWDRLADAVNRLAARHPVLSAVFAPDGLSYRVGEVYPHVQLVREESEFDQPPSLSNTAGPVLVVRGTSTYVELWIEHSVCDAQSLSIVAREIGELYDGEELSSPPPGFDDYARYMQSEAERQWDSATCARWLDGLRHTEWPPQVERRSCVPATFESAIVQAGTVEDISRRLRRTRVSPATYALYVATRSIASTTGSREILLGVTSAIRPLPEFGRTVGDFANMLLVATRHDQSAGDMQSSFGLAMSNYAIYHPRVSEALGCPDAGRVRIDFKPGARAVFRLGGQVGEPVPDSPMTSRDICFELQFNSGRAEVVVARRHGYDGLDFAALVDAARSVHGEWSQSV